MTNKAWFFSVAYLGLFVLSEHFGSLYPLTVVLIALAGILFWFQDRITNPKRMGGPEVLSFLLLVTSLLGMVNGCAGRVGEINDPGWRDRAPTNYEREGDREPFVP